MTMAAKNQRKVLRKEKVENEVQKVKQRMRLRKGEKRRKKDEIVNERKREAK